MILQEKQKIKYYYDASFDTINFYLKRARDVYSEEEYNGVYFIRDEHTDEIIGVEVLDFSNRNRLKLIPKLPDSIKELAESIYIAR